MGGRTKRLLRWSAAPLTVALLSPGLSSCQRLPWILEVSDGPVATNEPFVVQIHEGCEASQEEGDGKTCAFRQLKSFEVISPKVEVVDRPYPAQLVVKSAVPADEVCVEVNGKETYCEPVRIREPTRRALRFEDATCRRAAPRGWRIAPGSDIVVSPQFFVDSAEVFPDFAANELEFDMEGYERVDDLKFRVTSDEGEVILSLRPDGEPLVYRVYAMEEFLAEFQLREASATEVVIDFPFMGIEKLCGNAAELMVDVGPAEVCALANQIFSSHSRTLELERLSGAECVVTVIHEPSGEAREIRVSDVNFGSGGSTKM